MQGWENQKPPDPIAMTDTSTTLNKDFSLYWTQVMCINTVIYFGNPNPYARYEYFWILCYNKMKGKVKNIHKPDE